jgi:cytochrome c peroxidase
MAGGPRVRVFLCVAVVLAGLGAAPGLLAISGADGLDRPVRVQATYEAGRRVFFEETFSGNGRTCATCHDPRNEFTVSPELIQERYRLEPSHPLFRPIDSDDGAGADYTTLLTHALFRVHVPLHASVTVVDRPDDRQITVWRGVPAIVNVGLSGPYLHDGRATTLERQALGAINGHMEPRRRPTARELAALKVFEGEMYYPQRLRVVDDTSDLVPRPVGFSLPVQSPAALRGRELFDLRCLRCHGGELGDTPTEPGTSQFTNVLVSDVNEPNLPLLRLSFRLTDGTTVETFTPDPGRAAITGDIRDLNAFDTPSLRGVKHTAPYFHDNSATTLHEVVVHYNDVFQFQMSLQDRDDLVSYLELF